MPERVIDNAENWTRKGGLGFMLVVIAGLLWGILRGTRRPGGRKSGRLPEQALAAEFGEEWAAYCRQVPGWCPHFRPGHPMQKQEIPCLKKTIGQ